jgi:methyl-accepting chemotaxis protein
MTWKTTQGHYPFACQLFLIIVTYTVIRLFVAPELIETETKNIRTMVELQSEAITEQMNRVKAQQRGD